MGVATAGYCVGNLLLDDDADAPWEDRSFAYPESLASPLQVILGVFQALSGAPMLKQQLRSTTL